MGSNSASATAGKPIRCQAAVCRKAGEPLIIEEIEVAPPTSWEVRIKILCTSLCHSDVTFWKLSAGPVSAFPRILGHEAAGVVESVGENVEEVKEGDIVIPVFQRNCGECRDCKCPKGNICSKFPEDFYCGMPRDGSSRFKDKNGEKLYHTLCVSSFTEYTVVDVTHVVKMNPDFPIDKASLLSCGVSTGLGAAWRVADIEEGSTVAIFGLGAVGLAVVQGAKLRGAAKIIGVDLNPEKFEIGKKFGLTDFINPTTCGEKSTSQGTGKTVIIGIEMHGTPLSINPYELAAGKTITGSMFGGVKAKVDIPLFANQYLNNELNLEGYITHEVNFEDINKAFDLLEAGKTLRCIIWMGK
ncbi:alcohol dehydrogenase-like 1 isoform X2 [Solanum verrucosum]|uniref:alcohol dehydrogenase-like 1 isoform X2 n=1 Tax=Solanum verrucosum TaxID=315347 RepID=UPI0020D11AA7|nr:alcohol dehydrogenase-like 1 isoform X2 [Solanum verrucosum]